MYHIITFSSSICHDATTPSPQQSVMMLDAIDALYAFHIGDFNAVAMMVPQDAALPSGMRLLWSASRGHRSSDFPISASRPRQGLAAPSAGLLPSARTSHDTGQRFRAPLITPPLIDLGLCTMPRRHTILCHASLLPHAFPEARRASHRGAMPMKVTARHPLARGLRRAAASRRKSAIELLASASSARRAPPLCRVR